LKRIAKKGVNVTWLEDGTTMRRKLCLRTANTRRLDLQRSNIIKNAVITQ